MGGTGCGCRRSRVSMDPGSFVDSVGRISESKISVAVRERLKGGVFGLGDSEKAEEGEDCGGGEVVADELEAVGFRQPGGDVGGEGSAEDAGEIEGEGGAGVAHGGGEEFGENGAEGA